MSHFTLDLPDKLLADLTEAGRKAGQTPAGIASDLLRKAMAVRKFRAARKKIIERLGTDAPASEEQIFDEIS